MTTERGHAAGKLPAVKAWHGSYAAGLLGYGVVLLATTCSHLTDRLGFWETVGTYVYLAVPITIPLAFLGSWMTRIVIALEKAHA